MRPQPVSTHIDLIVVAPIWTLNSPSCMGPPCRRSTCMSSMSNSTTTNNPSWLLSLLVLHRMCFGRPVTWPRIDAGCFALHLPSIRGARHPYPLTWPCGRYRPPPTAPTPSQSLTGTYKLFFYDSDACGERVEASTPEVTAKWHTDAVDFVDATPISIDGSDLMVSCRISF